MSNPAETQLEQKLALLEAVLAYQEGKPPAEEIYPEMLRLCQALAPFDPSDDWLEREVYLEGTWELLYTNKSAFTPLERLPGFSLKRVLQSIDIHTSTVINLAELQSGPLETVVAIRAKFEPSGERRLTVKFEEAFITAPWLLGDKGLKSWLMLFQTGHAQGLKFDASNQQGWLDVLYVDETLRVGIGNEGNLFILTKKSKKSRV